MDTRSQNVLVNAAGFLYAFLGFSLSVLTSLFSLFQPRNPPSRVTLPAQLLPTKPNLPSDVRGRRIVRSFSDQSVGTPKPTPTSLGKLRETPTEKRKIISSHRRSRSLIPIIKIDHFDSIETPRQLSAELLKMEPRISESINPLPRPYRFTICLDDSLPNSGGSTGNMGVGVGDRPGFRLFNPKSWGKDRPKVERRSSSPQLCQLPLPPLIGSAAPHKQSNSCGKFKACSSSKGEAKPITRKVIRKAKSSYNVRESHNANAEPPPPVPRNVEKKRSQTLRTQPYEAPYFCTPPMPTPVRKSPRSNLRSPPPPLPSHSLDRKLSKPLVSNS